MPNVSLKSLSFAALVACLLAVLPASLVFAQDPDQDRAEREAWWNKTNAQIKGMRADWSGSVAGDINKQLQGKARLMFVEVDGGRLNVSLWLGESHTFYNGVAIHGLVSCARGPRTYPVWVKRRAYEQRPAGQLEAWYTDPDAIASRRAGVSRPPSDDTYKPEQGRVTLNLQEDRLELEIRALLDSGPIRFDEPPYETRSRILLTARTSVERTLENEDLFDTSRCEAKPPFEVVSVKPEDGRANVLLEKPEILVELSQDVHPENLENPDLIVVRTLLRPPELQADSSEPVSTATVDQTFTPAPPVLGDDEYLDERVPGTLDLKDPRTLRFTPSVPLRSGVRYQIDLAHGDDGIRSKDFHVLQEQWPTWFTTRVKPDQVRVNVYQTTRDAPLILRKPAMARVFIDWTESLDIHPDWQVEEAEFDVEITEEDENRVLIQTEANWMERPDQYDDEDRRLARDSVNRFGWTPEGKGVKKVVARIRPHDHWPSEREAPEDPGVRAVEYATRQVDDVDVEAVVVRMDEWRDEVPDQEVLADVMRAFLLDNEYARQVYPVVNVRGRLAGFFDAPYVSEVYSGLLLQAPIFHDYYARYSSADIVVGYYPPVVDDGRGQGILKYPQQKANIVLMPVRGTDSSPVPAILTMPLVAHEYGHVFGLEHVPRSDTRAERAVHCNDLVRYLAPSDGIEGFRILAGGMKGHSKSSTTGNGETISSLKNLMFPCQYDPRAMWWISDEHYKRLVENLPGVLESQRVLRYFRDDSRFEDPVSDAVMMSPSRRVKPDGVRWMLASGFVDGATARFLPVVDVPAPDTGPEPEGGLTVVVEAADGTRLASRRVARVGDQGGQGLAYFSAALEVAGEPARVVLLEGGREIAALGSAQPPAAPAILSHRDGAMLEAGGTLRWESPSDDADVLYSVRYRPEPDAPGRVLAALTNKTELPLDPAMLSPGREPSIDVVAHSGLHEARSRIRVQLPEVLRPMLVLPAGEIPAGDALGIGAWFNTALEPDSVREDTLRLLDGKGKPVPLRVLAAANGNGVQALPEVALEPGVRYTVHLAPGLKATDGRVMRSAVRWSFRAPVPEPEQAGDEAREQAPSVRLPRPVDPLGSPWNRDGADGPDAAADRASGEATVVETQAQAVPVEFRVCREAADTSARVLLDGRFGSGDGGGRFRLERVAGDALVFTVELEPRGDRGPVTGQRQGSLERPGQSGLTLSESAGHWTIAMMLDHQGGRIPVFLRANCGLD